jgi:hypothetical protein
MKPIKTDIWNHSAETKAKLLDKICYDDLEETEEYFMEIEDLHEEIINIFESKLFPLKE